MSQSNTRKQMLLQNELQEKTQKLNDEYNKIMVELQEARENLREAKRQKFEYNKDISQREHRLASLDEMIVEKEKEYENLDAHHADVIKRQQKTIKERNNSIEQLNRVLETCETERMLKEKLIFEHTKAVKSIEPHLKTLQKERKYLINEVSALKMKKLDAKKEMEEAKIYATKEYKKAEDKRSQVDHGLKVLEKQKHDMTIYVERIRKYCQENNIPINIKLIQYG